MQKLFAQDRDAWRKWLAEHHDTTGEIWLVYYKKETGKPSVTYTESVQEAICFGWIDGIIKKLDEETYTHRFSSRKKESRWSPLNIKYAEQMIAEGRMTDTGLRCYKNRKAHDAENIAMRKAAEIALPAEIEAALNANKTAWENYTSLAPVYRRQFAMWLTAAKRSETRAKRLAEVIKLLEKNEKLGMK